VSSGAVPGATGRRRLRAGAIALACLLAACAAGPWWARNPQLIVDPPVAALLPPGSQRYVVVLRDGSTLAADSAEATAQGWRLERKGIPERVPAERVARLTRVRFWLGTDRLGRDVLARLLTGGRVSLAVGFLSLAVALVLGIGAGLLAGWSGGVVDACLMRLVDGLLAVPMLFLLILLAALFRPSLASLIAVLGFSAWMGVARLVRGQVLTLKGRDFVVALRGIGAGPMRIAFVHLLPNLLTPVAQDAALRLGDLILAEATLSFLGLGVQAPHASWGAMIQQGGEHLISAWWLTFLPGIAIAVTVIATALLADGIADVTRDGAGDLA
jgi:peptide/nickel transport system permease protein